MGKSVQQLQEELAKAEAATKLIKAKIKDQQRSEKMQSAKKTRAQDQRKRYCLGGHLLKMLKDDSEQRYTATEIMEQCRAGLTRNVDRVAFGLEPLPKKTKAD